MAKSRKKVAKHNKTIRIRGLNLKLSTSGLLLSLTAVLAIVTIVLNYNHIFKKQDSSKINPVSIGTLTDYCQQKTTVTYSCYKKELTDLVNQKGPEYAMALLKQQYDKNNYVKTECHQLTHTVGRAAYDRYQNLADTYVHGDYFCASGYYHGASEEIIAKKGADYMTKDPEKICATFAQKERYMLNHYNCVHGIGHGLMEATDSDLFASLKICDKLADRWESDSCDSGVFMQNIMDVESPDETADHTSKYLRPDQPMYPCTAVDDRYKVGCYIIQSSYALTVLNYDFVKVFGLCAQAGPFYSTVCYGSIGRDASGYHNLDQQYTVDTCNLGQNYEAVVNCIEGAAKNIIYSYHSDKQAYEFCSAVKENYRFDCRKTVRDYYATF